MIEPELLREVTTVSSLWACTNLFCIVVIVSDISVSRGQQVCKKERKTVNALYGTKKATGKNTLSSMMPKFFHPSLPISYIYQICESKSSKTSYLLSNLLSGKNKHHGFFYSTLIPWYIILYETACLFACWNLISLPLVHCRVFGFSVHQHIFSSSLRLCFDERTNEPRTPAFQHGSDEITSPTAQALGW